MKKKLFPFGAIPSNWKLEGKDRRRAYAHYTLEGDELELELLKIEHDNRDSQEYKIALLDYELKKHRINQDQYDKSSATIKGEPYFKILQGKYVPSSNDQGTMSFELDWNDIFVKELKDAGWEGKTPDAVVNLWFDDACRQMFVEEAIEPLATVTPYRTRKNISEPGKTEYS